MSSTMDETKELDEIRDELKIIWKKILKDIREDGDLSELKGAVNWLEVVLEENVPFGKQTRGTAMTIVYRRIVKERDPKVEFLAHVMGWVAEILHTFGLMVDDMMDGSKIRRGRPAWYVRSDIGMNAINDALMLENLIWKILRKYFYETEFYEKMLFLVQDAAFLSILGQSYDTRFSLANDFSKFTQQSYDTIVKYKTSIYSFYTPVAVGMILAGINDDKAYKDAKEILCEIGRMFQIQDDYLDLYGDPKVTGKVGTDIQDGKCSWLIVEALERSSIEQKEILQDCYGSKKIDDVHKIEEVYKKLKLKQVFHKYEIRLYDRIKEKINHIEPESLRPSLLFLLNGIYKRKK